VPEHAVAIATAHSCSYCGQLIKVRCTWGFKCNGSVQIAAGKDADLLLLDQASLELKSVYAKGLLVRTPEWTRGGMFERGERIRPIKPAIPP